MSYFAEVDREARLIEDALYDADRVTDSELVRVDCRALAARGGRTAEELAAYVVGTMGARLQSIAARSCGGLFDLDEVFEYAARWAYARYFAALFC